MNITTVGVLGSGVMGGGIAQMFAENGVRVLLWDVDRKITEKGMENIKKRLTKSVEKGKIGQNRLEKIMKGIQSAPSLDAMRDAQLVIEAVIEDFNVKTDIYRRLENIIPSTTIVGTNTSSLSVASLSSSFQTPGRFLGIHFFNPPTKLELVELVSTDATSAEAESTIREFLTVCGKTPVKVNESPGFIVNRLLLPMINDAAKLLDAGVAETTAIDTAMRLGALHPVGPLELADIIGLDVCVKILNEMASALDNPACEPAAALLERVETGRLGRKTKHGFYDYE
ncbi:MAG: 3-hydroxyacyl-CoA dehydrogenase family protein [Victivallales bacterium]|nr:3-hydroxyacyl-CoA dehydrogenase family protein [Victivallales bacterium]